MNAYLTSFKVIQGQFTKTGDCLIETLLLKAIYRENRLMRTTSEYIGPKKLQGLENIKHCSGTYDLCSVFQLHAQSSVKFT